MKDTNLKEIIIYKYLNEKKSCRKIGLELGYSSTYIYEYLTELGLVRTIKRTKPKIADKYKDEIIDLYINQKLSVLKIADKLNISRDCIYDGLKSWKIDRRSFKEMSHFKANYKFFNKIDSEEKAYWLGFMYADGFITSDCIGLALKITDKSHIEKFKIALDSNHSINDYENNSKSKYGNTKYSRLLFKSVELTNDLINLGCVNNKSLILKFPSYEQVPQKFIKDFIRGYFDGDGSIVLSKNSINFKICGTKEFLTGVIDELNKNISNYEFKYQLYKRKNDNKNNYYLSFGGRLKTLAVVSWMYENSNIYLDRKYELYLKLKQL